MGKRGWVHYILWLVIVTFLLMWQADAALAAVPTIPITVNLSEAVFVNTGGGVPRIRLDVGGVTRYATYSSGTGTTSLIFTYAPLSGDVDADGITVFSPVQANGGTLRDVNGNDANLNFTVPNTSGVLVDCAVPSGYSATFIDDTVTNTNRTGLSFRITSPKVGRTYNYTISSSGGGTPLSGSGPLSSSPLTISGINATSLPDGILTLSVTLTDSLGGIGSAATDTIPMAVLGSSLVGHWTFDANDISGTTVYDRSGSSYNATMINSPTQTTGVTGGGLATGATGYVQVASGAASLSAPFSISIWAQTATAAATNGFVGSRSPSDNGFDAKFQNGNLIHGDIGNGSSWISTVADATYSYSANTWHHIVYVVTTTSYTIYANGVQVKTASFAPAAPLLFNSTHLLGLGRSYSSSEYLNGKIDDARVYNIALSSAQVSQLYSSH